MITSTITGLNRFKPKAMQGQNNKNLINQSLNFRGRGNVFSRICGKFSGGEEDSGGTQFKKKLRKELKSAKTVDGEDRFSDSQISSILPCCNTENKEALDTLIAAKTVDGKDRFGGYHISSILPYCNTENKESLDTLIAAKDVDGKDRFDGCEISSILKELKPENKEALDALIAAKDVDGKDRFDGREINSILKELKPENKEALYSLIAAKDVDGKDRFNSYYDIISILTYCNTENKEALDAIIAAKTVDGEDRFNGYDITRSILPYYNTEKKEALDLFIAAKTVDGEDRFDGSEISSMLKELRPENKELLDSLIAAKTVDGKDRFDGSEIGYILQHNKDEKNHTIFNKLLQARTIDEENYIFNGYEIYNIYYRTIRHRKNENVFNEFLDTLLNARSTDGKNRFNGQQIADIIPIIVLKPENKEDFEALLNAKTTDGKNRFNGDDISNILPYKANKLLNMLIDVKEGENYKYPGHNIFKIFCILSSISNINHYLASRVNKKFLVKENFEELDRKDKNSLLMNLSSYNEFFQNEVKRLKDLGFENELTKEILETEPKELLIKTIKSIKKAVKVNPLSDPVITDYFNAINNIDKNIKDFDVDKNKLELTYPRANFINDLSNNLNDLDDEQKRGVFNCYGFNLDDGKLTGYPVVLEDETEKPDIPEEKKNAIEETIKKFTINNKISIIDKNTESSSGRYKDLETNLNNIVKALPEFLTSVGKEQHKTQKYTLDMHQLKVLKEFITHPGYSKLSDKDKKLGKMAILIHDIAKKEGEEDKAHPLNSSIDAYHIIKKLKLPEFEHDRVISLIKNHHWSEELVKSQKSEQDVAFEFRKPGDFDISKIFAEADLKSINDTFYDDYKDILKDNIKKVQPLVNNIHSTGIWLPRTPLSKASQIKKPKYVSEIKGVKGPLKVIDLIDFDEFYGIIHAIGNRVENNKFTQEEAEMFGHIADEGNEGVLSTSFVSKNNFNTYNEVDGKKYGFVLDVDPSNIAAFSKQNISSGLKKNINSFKNYLFAKPNNNKYDYRREFSSKLKSKLKIDEIKYRDVYKDLSQKQDLKELKNDPKSFHCNAYDSIKATLREFFNKDGYNELITYAAKPTAVFAKGKENIENKLNDMPEGLKTYAVEHDLPVLNVTV